jgi:elongation factor Ts
MVNISTVTVKELRKQSGAGIMDCRNALVEAEGNMEKAAQLLKERSIFKVEKKKTRSASQRLIEAYVHAGGRIGAMIELNCETDFVARTDEFKQLAHQLVLQVAAMSPQFIAHEDIGEADDVEPQVACLLLQPYIRDSNITIQDLINETIARIGENIKVSRFARFEVGE